LPPAPSTLSLHDALPILFWSNNSFIQLPDKFCFPCLPHSSELHKCLLRSVRQSQRVFPERSYRKQASPKYRLPQCAFRVCTLFRDRKSTRLNSSHVKISY